MPKIKRQIKDNKGPNEFPIRIINLKYNKYLFNFLFGIKYNKYFRWTTVLRDNPIIKAPKQRKVRDIS